jgi:hypothetical protein
VQAAVFTDYVEYRRRNMIALITNDLTRAGVLDYLTGAEATKTTTLIADRRRQKIRTLGVVKIAPAVGSVNATGAVIHDCLDQSGMYDVNAAGTKTPLPARVGVSVTLVQTDGSRWRVSQVSGVAC